MIKKMSEISLRVERKLAGGAAEKASSNRGKRMRPKRVLEYSLTSASVASATRRRMRQLVAHRVVVSFSKRKLTSTRRDVRKRRQAANLFRFSVIEIIGSSFRLSDNRCYLFPSRESEVGFR